jgi:hypothetical protein
MRLQKQYEHDEDAHVTYFVVSRAKKGKTLCSAVYRSVRQGAVLSSGRFELTPHRLQFTTRYADAKKHILIPGGNGKVYVAPDSSRTVFLPDGRGELRLTQAQDFRSGEVTTHDYWPWLKVWYKCYMAVSPGRQRVQQRQQR